MLSKTHIGFTIPIEDLPIPKGHFQRLSPPVQRAFLVALSTVVSNYLEYRRQSINLEGVPEEDGTTAMRQLMRTLLQRQDLSLLEPLMILPSLIFGGMDEFLDRKALEFIPDTKVTLGRLSAAGVPIINYEPDRWIEITWYG